MSALVRTTLFALRIAPCVCAWACSTSPTQSSAGATWPDGKVLSSDEAIGPGSVVTIAPGAKISVASGVTVTVAGTLQASSGSGRHVSLSPLAGSQWGGLVVAKGGTLKFAGVDVSGAQTGIRVLGGGSAQYDQGTMDGAGVPFRVDAGSTLGTTRATVTNPMGESLVSGSLVASHLTYDANGHSAIVTGDVLAKLSIEDSTFAGLGQGADLIIAGGAASIHMAYVDISAAHCAFHFDDVDAFDITHTNVHDNVYGFMLYGSSGAGPRSVTYSNVQNNSAFAFDTSGMNGPIVFDHSYVTGSQTTGGVVSITNAQAVAVGGTGPRGP